MNFVDFNSSLTAVNRQYEEDFFVESKQIVKNLASKLCLNCKNCKISNGSHQGAKFIICKYQISIDNVIKEEYCKRWERRKL